MKLIELTFDTALALTAIAIILLTVGFIVVGSSLMILSVFITSFAIPFLFVIEGKEVESPFALEFSFKKICVINFGFILIAMSLVLFFLGFISVLSLASLLSFGMIFSFPFVGTDSGIAAKNWWIHRLLKRKACMELTKKCEGLAYLRNLRIVYPADEKCDKKQIEASIQWYKRRQNMQNDINDDFYDWDYLNGNLFVKTKLLQFQYIVYSKKRDIDKESDHSLSHRGWFILRQEMDVRPLKKLNNDLELRTDFCNGEQFKKIDFTKTEAYLFNIVPNKLSSTKHNPNGVISLFIGGDTKKLYFIPLCKQNAPPLKKIFRSLNLLRDDLQAPEPALNPDSISTQLTTIIQHFLPLMRAFALIRC